jgi:hypothetical protein
VVSYKFFFTLNEANTCVSLPNAFRPSVRALSYSVIATIMDQEQQLFKPLNKQELYTDT